jgi:hypothetical protein
VPQTHKMHQRPPTNANTPKRKHWHNNTSTHIKPQLCKAYEPPNKCT